MKILFVCLGNICRSPMAEYLLRHKLKQHQLDHLVSVDSAGTAGYHDGDDMHHGTKQILQHHQINTDGFISRKVRLDDIKQYDCIIAMDNHNLKDLEQLFGQQAALFKVTDLDNTLGFDHIPDPWYTGDFNQTYQLLDRCCNKLIEKIKKELPA